MASAYIVHCTGELYDIIEVPQDMSVSMAGILCLGDEYVYDLLCRGPVTHLSYYMAMWEPRDLSILELTLTLNEIGCYATTSPASKSNTNTSPSYIIEGV